MASIRKEIEIDAPAEHVWAAIRDVGAVHMRLAQEFVVDTKLDGDSRLVTFADGEVVRERIVDVDDQARRLAYAVVEWRTTHHNASFQVLPDGHERCRLVWITDLLPDTLADLVGAYRAGVRGDEAHARSTNGGIRRVNRGPGRGRARTTRLRARFERRGVDPTGRATPARLDYGHPKRDSRGACWSVT